MVMYLPEVSNNRVRSISRRQVHSSYLNARAAEDDIEEGIWVYGDLVVVAGLEDLLDVG